MSIAYNDMRYSDAVSWWITSPMSTSRTKKTRVAFSILWSIHIDDVFTSTWAYATGKCSFQWREEVDLIGRQSAVD